MIVKIAKESGFCFGVKRAMDMAWESLENKNSIYALGPLIHNKQAVSKYEEKGLLTVDSLENIPNNESVIIRSHGVGKDIYDFSNKKNLDIIDTTCPFVKKIHDIANRYYNLGYQIIVIGDKNHPEVIGINGWCENNAIVIKTIDEANELVLNNDKKYCIVSQTTINLDLYENIKSILEKKIKNITFNNTICSATKVRQEAAKKLSKEVECMIVIGGKHSSNTQKLVNICKENVDTFSIETKNDLDINLLKAYNVVGISAGASTPDWIIDEVVEFLENIL